MKPNTTFVKENINENTRKSDICGPRRIGAFYVICVFNLDSSQIYNTFDSSFVISGFILIGMD
jgi:hypothetical protein